MPLKVLRHGTLGLLAVTAIVGPVLAGEWFYGHPAPIVPPDIAAKNWRDCIVAASKRLDDRISSVMDIASAIEPMCSAKAETMIDAMNKDFLESPIGDQETPRL